ncbi:MAG: hypothetical protein L0H70_04540, partial [Xanthomonadales bacterium]|nr:hypothetical protein [Xanthomonadales bacterium]
MSCGILTGTPLAAQQVAVAYNNYSAFALNSYTMASDALASVAGFTPHAIPANVQFGFANNVGPQAGGVNPDEPPTPLVLGFHEPDRIVSKAQYFEYQAPEQLGDA